MISKNDRYGAQRIFLDQVKVLHEMGSRVIVVGRGNEGYVPDTVRNTGVEYHGIAMKGFSDILLLRKLIKKYNIQVIHTTLDRADYLGIILSKFAGVPVVSTMMVPRYHIGFRFADRVVVISTKLRILLEQKGVPARKISVIRPGIDVQRFTNPDPYKREAWKEKLNIESYSIVFCHIASIIPRKAHEVSIDLMAACKKLGENPLLIIIGDPLHGEYFDSLVRKIAEAGLKQSVYFTGWTADTAELLSLSHFTLLPSENEALGIVLMEGMAAGTPIIARENEGGAELIAEYGTGFLYEANNVAGLADKVVALKRDGVQYRILSNQCEKIAEKEFSLQRFGKRLIELYRNI